MKIVQVVTRGDVLGGAQSHVLELSRHLRGLGHDITVVTGKTGAWTERLYQERIRCVALPALVHPIRPFRDVTALFALWRVLGKLSPDLVCAHTAKAGFLGRMAAWSRDIPNVFTPHGWSMIDRSTLHTRWTFWAAEAAAAKLGTRIITVCEYERASALGLNLGAAEKIAVVPNGISPASLPRRRRVDTQPPNIVMVARFCRQKDHNTLLQALAGLQVLDWKLHLVGAGPLEEQVRAMIDTLGLSHRIHIHPANKPVQEVLMNVQLFVLATNFEALPITILEAMRAGLPVIATDVGGIAEAVRDGETGLLVGRGDVAGWQQALTQLITDPALRCAMGCAGQRVWSEQFTADLMTARTLQVYEEALTSRDREAALRFRVRSKSVPAGTDTVSPAR